ncbi:MAG: TIGR03936 family radical SAM-associated protein [bacterium]|nr:TIGR03936 family radical SAM-associated protein [bacterium]MDY4099091.1 TIGR03936 family radical SAM-associated protein [Lachnospiraceae bacterium]
MKIRIKFSKSGNMKFIGHLDTMRYFQKAMRRADIDIAYSTGFSPHQIMSFAAPLGVGITSEGEYMDIEVNSTGSTSQSIRALNDAMVNGFSVLDYRKLPDHAKTAMSIVTCADYTLTYREGYETDLSYEQLCEAVHAFYDIPEKIEIVKQTKKAEKIIDLKQLVYEFKVLSVEGKPAFYVKVSTGSSDNIKPELVLEHFYKYLGAELQKFTFQTHRHDVYSGSVTEGFCSLNDMGEVIE